MEVPHFLGDHLGSAFFDCVDVDGGSQTPAWGAWIVPLKKGGSTVIFP